ncbi:hypothetical protein MWMV18_MWMV18_02772 [Acinetobacter calcoaceticus]|nr:hypothetical protein MWMV18_MWMV18_02772 [Acinetobacter calcoaceticus]
MILFVASPKAIAPCVDFHTFVVCVDVVPVTGSKPATPAAVFATESLPIATPPLTFALAPEPIAVASATELALLPIDVAFGPVVFAPVVLVLPEPIEIELSPTAFELIPIAIVPSS